MVDGVSPSSKWLPVGHWKTLFDFLQDQFPEVEPATWLSRMAKGQVVDETGRCLDAKSPYSAGSCIFYYRELETEPHIPFPETVLFQDEHLLVADKPHFLPVVPAGRFLQETLLVRLKKKLNLESLVPLHRIDRETAGLVLFSINPATRTEYTMLFQNRNIEKVYHALAALHPELRFPLIRHSRIVTGEPFFRMQEVDGPPNTETWIDQLERRNNLALYELGPRTGKKHQLRLHLTGLGIPIQNDSLYPEIIPMAEDDFSKPLKLLAKSLAFRDPITRQERFFESTHILRSS
ncbi:MAG: pseudouridine synthase [Acidobacteria bacterium]|nr:pseudouridine synthase [Acidobacteriota bacterium]